MNLSSLRRSARLCSQRWVWGVLATAFLAGSLPASAANGRNPIRVKPASTVKVALVSTDLKAPKPATEPAATVPAPAVKR